MNKKNSIDKKIVIIILNLNGWRDTLECLESIYQTHYKNYDLILVDNGSTDDSIEKIKSYCKGEIITKSPYFDYSRLGKPIKLFEYKIKIHKKLTKIDKEYYNSFRSNKLILLKLRRNLGFAGGNNIGILFALKNLDPDYILLLNNDIVIEKNLLNETIQVCENIKHLGIAGPEVRRYQNPDRLQFEDLYKNINEAREVNWISGCAFFIKTKVVKKVGILDQIFISYFEETDYIKRAKKASFKIIYIPTKSKVYHKVAQTSKKKKNYAHFYMTRNYIIFWKKHSSKREFSLKILRHLINQIKYLIQNEPFLIITFIKGTLSGFFFSFLR